MYLSYDSGLFLIENNSYPTHQFLFILFILFSKYQFGESVYSLHTTLFFILFIVVLGVFVVVAGIFFYVMAVKCW